MMKLKGVQPPPWSGLTVALMFLSGVQLLVKVVTEHLLMRVDEDFKLPVEADLIAEATWLIDYLENET